MSCSRCAVHVGLILESVLDMQTSVGTQARLAHRRPASPNSVGVRDRTFPRNPEQDSATRSRYQADCSMGMRCVGKRRVLENLCGKPCARFGIYLFAPVVAVPSALVSAQVEYGDNLGRFFHGCEISKTGLPCRPNVARLQGHTCVPVAVGIVPRSHPVAAALAGRARAETARARASFERWPWTGVATVSGESLNHLAARRCRSFRGPYDRPYGSMPTEEPNATQVNASMRSPGTRYV